MFYKKVNKNNNKNMYEFLKGHFEYETLNSWNGLYSIANNVKIYNLELEGDYWRALEMLEREKYLGINGLIADWQEEHQNYRVYFNGKSGGYLVLYNKENNDNVLDWYITNSNDYEHFKELLKDDNMTLKEYHNTLVEQVEIVQDFDKLCDNLRTFCQNLIDNYTYNEEGKCPICGSDNLDYDALEVTDYGVHYPYTCKDCGTTGVEHYDLQFSENEILNRKGSE